MKYKDIIKINLNKINEEINKNKNVYLFGAGETCKYFIKNFPFKNNIRGIFDNDGKKTGLYIENVKIYDAISLKKIQKDDILIITSIYMKEIKKQLELFGHKNIFSFYEVGGYVGENFKCIGSELLQYSHLPLSRKQLLSVNKFKKFLADDLSKEILERIILMRQQESPFFGYDYLDECDITGGGIFSFSLEEIMVDAGAYTGDTIEYFRKTTNDRFKKIYAFEPDWGNFNTLKNNVNSDSRINLINSGLWENRDYLYFSDENKDTSHFSNCGIKKVFVQDLDSFISEPITFIKMDIEGSELKALKGAEKIIKNFRPKLSIAIYHHYNDLWDIPILLSEWVPEYNFYIRQQSFSQSETILYAKLKD